MSKQSNDYFRVININGISRLFPRRLFCPLTHELMEHPVVACDGHVYERDAIINWMTHTTLSPTSRCEMLTSLVITSALIIDLIAWKNGPPRINIAIKLHNRLLTRINVSLTMRVGDIKRKIAMKTGISIDDQILMYNNKILGRDSQPIDALQMKSGDELIVSRRFFAQKLATIPEE